MSLNVNGTIVNKVNFNGSAVSQVIVNGATVWPYLPGTTIFTYGWSPNGNLNTFITNTYATYPLAFVAAPYYTTGSAGTPGNQILNWTLSPGFQVSSYTQAQLGTQAPYQTAGFNFDYMWCGRTVTGLQQSGNGSSSITVSFVGTIPYKQVFTSGSGNWTVPSGVTSIVVTMIGAGGNGNANEGVSNPGPGGGSGAYFNSVTISVTPGQSIAYSVGVVGGTLIASGDYYNGNPIYIVCGSNTTFGSLTAGGGIGGHWRAGNSPWNDEHGGAGGTATGTGGVNGTAGNDGSKYSGNGYGANSPFGTGGVGIAGQAGSNGGNATGYGAGGGGGGNNSSGGTGSPGIIYINY